MKRRSMQSYRRLKLLVAALLCGYAAAALVLKVTLRRDGEVFPVFSWSLYSTVPGEDTDYAVRILSVGGKALDPPLFLQEARSFFTGTEPTAAFMTMQRLGDALEKRDADEVKAHRRLLEEHHLRGQGVIRYEIVRRRFNTLARWSSGGFTSVRTVAVLSTDGAGP